MVEEGQQEKETLSSREGSLPASALTGTPGV